MIPKVFITPFFTHVWHSQFARCGRFFSKLARSFSIATFIAVSFRLVFNRRRKFALSLCFLFIVAKIFTRWDVLGEIHWGSRSMLSYARNTFVDYLTYPDISLAHELINVTIVVGVEIVFGIDFVDGVQVCFARYTAIYLAVVTHSWKLVIINVLKGWWSERE